MATLIKTQAIGTYSDYYLRLYIEETVNVSANTSAVTVSLYGYTERAADICYILQAKQLRIILKAQRRYPLAVR